MWNPHAEKCENASGYTKNDVSEYRIHLWQGYNNGKEGRWKKWK